MSLRLANTLTAHLGSERKLKNQITVRLVEPHERATFPTLLEWTEKGHGRLTTYRAWHASIDPSDLGLAGAARLLRIRTVSEHLRQGKVRKTTDEVSHAVSSLWEHEATVQQVFDAIRGHWSNENRQHHRRDRTQDEDRCGMRNSRSAQNEWPGPHLQTNRRRARRGRRGREMPLAESRVLRRPPARRSVL